MHDPNATGVDYFICDFCRKPWTDDRPMVEGHQGSLICASCLTLACLSEETAGEGEKCVMCLMMDGIKGQRYESPTHTGTIICDSCIKEHYPEHALDE